jgi:hypothetical protein
MATQGEWFPSGNSGQTSNAGLWFPGLSKTDSYAKTALALAKASHPGHHSDIGGFLAHLAGDVVTSAEGLPAGIVHLATQNPITSAKEIYKGEKAQWSPLLTGDYNKFLHNFYEHPLGPILDTAGLLTGGAGIAARLGMLGKFGVGAERTLQMTSKIGETAEAPIDMGRFSANPVIRLRQKAFDQITKQLPNQTPLMGESARAARSLARITAEKTARSKTVVDTYRNAAIKLKAGHVHTAYIAVSTGQAPLTILKDMRHHIDVHNEKTATDISKLKTKIDAHQHIKPLETDTKKIQHQWMMKDMAMQRRMDDLVGSLRQMEPSTEQALLDPKAQRLFHEVQAAHMKLKKEKGYEADPEHRVNIHSALSDVKLSRDVRKVLIARDAAKDAAHLDAQVRKLPFEQTETRKYLHQLLRKGATFEPDKLALVEHRGELKLADLGEDGKVALISRKGNVSNNFRARVDASKITKIKPEEAQAYLDEAFPLSAPDVSRALYHKNGIANELKKLQTTHKKIGYAEPVYFPDKLALDIPKEGVSRESKYSGGLATSIKNQQNLGSLYMAGVINHDPLILAKQAMTSVMVAHAADIAETLRAHATAYHGKGVPKGYVALTKMSVARPYMNEYIDQFRKEMAHHLENGNAHDMTRQFLDNHVTDSAGAAADGHKLIIPQKVVDALAPEYQKSSGLAQAFYKNPQRVWKHMVLAGRPAPFIVNNIVGNSLMYALRHAGPGGIHALVGARNEESTLEKLFASRHLSFGQAHAIKREGKLAATLNAPYRVVGFHEHMVRRASMIASAKAMPEVRAELRRLRGSPAVNEAGETRLHQAIVAADKKHKGIIAQIGDHIDDVAGDYRHFSKGEERVRDIMPFYAWTRHAARSYYRLLTDRPLTAAMITHIGQNGSKQQQQMMGDLPGYMNQYIPSHLLRALGYGKDARSSVFNAKVLNPEATVADTIKTIGALVSGKPGQAPSDLTANLSPLVTAPIEATTGMSLLTGAPIKKNFLSGHGALGGAFGNVAVNLPIPKLLETLLPAGTPGSAKRDPTDIHNLFTPTGKPKTQHQDTIAKDWQTQVLNTILGIPAKSIDVKAAQEQKKSADTKARNASGFHVAKKRKSTRKSSVNGNWFK